ncbi:hypothetical protein HaLaN_02523, partial [Haematococcus lacustris]
MLFSCGSRRQHHFNNYPRKACVSTLTGVTVLGRPALFSLAANGTLLTVSRLGDFHPRLVESSQPVTPAVVPRHAMPPLPDAS